MMVNLSESPRGLPAAPSAVQLSESLFAPIAVYFSLKHMISVFIKTYITLQNLIEMMCKQRSAHTFCEGGIRCL